MRLLQDGARRPQYDWPRLQSGPRRLQDCTHRLQHGARRLQDCMASVQIDRNVRNIAGGVCRPSCVTCNAANLARQPAIDSCWFARGVSKMATGSAILHGSSARLLTWHNDQTIDHARPRSRRSMPQALQASRVRSRSLLFAVATMRCRIPAGPSGSQTGLSTSPVMPSGSGETIAAQWVDQASRRNMRAGNINNAASNSNTPPTAIPTNRNGSSNSQTIG
jgi:hypothetical protein